MQEPGAASQEIFKGIPKRLDTWLHGAKRRSQNSLILIERQNEEISFLIGLHNPSQ
jgi:hypothetical protein